jgi:tetratricopeptide (TPR) repeat protein
MAVSPTLGDVNLHAAAAARLGMVYYAVGDFGSAIALFKRSLAVEDPGPRKRQTAVVPGFFTNNAVNVRVWLACTYCELGEFGPAARIAHESLAVAEAANDPWWLVHAYYSIGLQRLLQGDPGEAIPVLERGVQLSLNADIPISFALIAPVLGAAYGLTGRPHDGIPLLEKACDTGSSIGAGNLQSRRVCWLGEARLLLDHVDDATRLAEQALQLARDHKESPDEARAHRLLGEVAIYRNPPRADAAESHFHHGMELARKLGMRPLVAHCHLGLGKLCWHTGRRQEAQEHLGIATTMYREMDMTYWLEQADAEMKTLT